MNDFKLRMYGTNEGSNVTAKKIVEQYLEVLHKRVEADDYSAEHYANVERDLLRFATFLPKLIDDCQQSDLLAWIDRNPQWRSAHKKKSAVSAIITCFKWAADSDEGDFIDRSPFRRIKQIAALPYQAHELIERPDRQQSRIAGKSGCGGFDNDWKLKKREGSLMGRLYTHPWPPSAT